MTQPRSVTVIILAAGEGTRMKSRTPKVLHSFCGRSMLGHVLASAAGLDPQQLIVVAGHGRDEVSAEAARCAPGVRVVVQDRLGGTGHAVRIVTETLGDLPGIVMVTCGNIPLLRTATLAALVREHAAAGNAMTVLTSRVPDPSGYGRIIRDDRGSLAEIIEDADATSAQRAIDEIDSSCYVFDGALLAKAARRVAAGAARSEEYLAAVAAILRRDGHLVDTMLAADPAEIQAVNDRVQLAQAQHAYNQRLLEAWMRAGVTIMDPSATWIDVEVTLAPDAEILPGTHLEGRTDIGPGARIGPGCVLRDTVVGASATVIDTVCESMEIEPGANVRGLFPSPVNNPYVNQHILDDIRKKNGSSKFNVTKLLRLIEEMNINYEQRNSYAAHALLRAILDHIPPILGHPDFKAVASNYSWQRTDRQYMKKLLDFRNQADDALHRQISERVDVLDFDDIPASVYIDRLLQECAANLLLKISVHPKQPRRSPPASSTSTATVALQRLYCLFVRAVSSRYVHILGITTNPDGPWTT